MALVKSVRLNIITDPGTAKEKLDAITAKAEKLGRLSPEIKVKVDDAAAALKLSVLKHELKNTGTETETLGGKFRNMSRSLDQAIPKFANLAAAGLALGPALLPVLAGATAATLGLSSAIAGAGAALGIFGIAAKSNLADMEKQLKKVQAANLAANKALATPPSQRTASQKQQIADAKAMTAAFKKEFGALAAAQDGLKKVWDSFRNQGGIVNSTLARGMNVIAAALPHFTPLLKLGATAVQAFEGALAGFTVGGGLDRLVAGLTKLGRIGLTGLLAVAHNLAVAFGALSGGAGAFAQGAISGLVRLSAAFANWAQNKGSGALTGLMRTVKQLGPGVVTLIRSLAAVVPNLAKGLFPLAPLSLALSTALAGIIANVPPGVITALATAFLAMYAAVKLAAGITEILKVKTALLLIGEKAQFVWGKIVAGATKAWAAAQWLLNAAMDANVIGVVVLAVAALAAGLVYAYQHSETFRKIVQAALHIALAAAQALWNWLKRNWPLLLAILTGPIGAAVIIIIRNWGRITAATKAMQHDIAAIWDLIWNNTIGRVQRGISDVMSRTAGFRHNITSAFDRIRHDIASIWDALWDITLGRVSLGVSTIMTRLRGFWSAMKSGFASVVSVLGNVWSRLEGIFRRPVSFLINTVYDGGIARLWNDVMNAIGGPKLPVIRGFAAGGRITAGTTGTADDVLVRVSRGETIVPAHLTPAVAPVLAGKVPGFAKGGIVGGIGGLLGLAGDAAKMAAAALTGNRKAFTNALTHAERPLFGKGGASADLLKMMVGIPVTMISKIIAGLWSKIKALGGGWGSQDAIAKYALSFAGKVPYVWGGTTPKGWDCSGFTSWVYKHFGYNSIPRTSEAQGAWVKRSKPQAGALAFFNSPAGGPSPGHVGIVTGAGHMVSALGRQWGTIVTPTAGALYYGIPPGGFRVPGRGGSGRANAALARSMYPAWGHGAQWNAWNALEMAEAGWNSRIRNPSSGALGIAQALGHGIPGGGGSLGNQYGGYGLSKAADRLANSGVPQPQITWMRNYIKSTYGNPVRAEQHELSHHWYDKGGWLPKGLSLAYNGTGRPERVLGPGEDRRIVLEIRSGPSDYERFLTTQLQRIVRVQGGGDVQVALGT